MADPVSDERLTPNKMLMRTILLCSISTLLLGCNTTAERERADKELREKISGDWVRIMEYEDAVEEPPPLPSFIRPQGMTIMKDSVEFYRGFFEQTLIGGTGESSWSYLGTFAPYKIEKNRIFIKNPSTHQWQSQWCFVSRKSDTLSLTVSDTIITKYRRLYYNLDTLTNYDHIVYSSTGCYGTCPLIDISITNAGEVLFQGEGFVKPQGFYAGTSSPQETKYVFDKFKRADPLRLEENYFAGHSDDQLLATTFIKDGKIIKTIQDYGMAGPIELSWAYVPISNIHSTTPLNRLPLDKPYYPKLRLFGFKKNDLVLPLAKSESFYLWTELKKAKQGEQAFQPLYSLTFFSNDYYWGPDPNSERHEEREIGTIASDGRFYKFDFLNAPSITYDLGYNFIDRNFDTADFKSPKEWYE